MRREFFPEDYARAVASLTRSDTDACTPGEAPARMHKAALNVALGDLAGLKRAIRMARTDYRDVLFYGDDPACRDKPAVIPDPGEVPASAEEEAFLKGIRRKPADTLIRLVYADWLDERGEDRRAEYLRVLCRWLTEASADPELIARERELRAGLGHGWLARIRGIRVREVRGRKKAR